MSYAPQTLLTLRDYLQRQTGLSAISLGVVGDSRHKSGYHLGRDRIFSSDGLGSDDYSVKTARDKAGLSGAASAIDIGMFPRLYAMSTWLVSECRRNAPDTRDIREVIWSPDGNVVLRWDRERGVSSAPRPGEADLSHLKHSHVSWYRDSEQRQKTGPFVRWVQLEAERMRTFDILPGATVGEWDVSTSGHYYVPLQTDAAWVGPITPPFHKDIAFGPVKLTVPLPGGAAGADRATGVVIGTRAAFMLWSDGVFSPIREVGVLETTQIDSQTVQVKIKSEE